MTTLAYGAVLFGVVIVGLTVLAPVLALKWLVSQARQA